MQPLELSELTGTASRTYQTRTVTGKMINSPIHVAVALWDVPWESAAGGKLNGWVIGISIKGGNPRIITGQTKTKDPVPQVVKDVQEALARTYGKVWIVTGRRQVSLRRSFEELGYTVTGSFSHENAAVRRVSRLRGTEERKALRRARKEEEAPRTKVAAEVPVTAAHWWPNVRDFSRAGATKGTLRIATDASSDTQTKGSMCFVASNGDYQLRTRPSAASTNELELETITLALKYAAKTKCRELIIETDSQGALDAATHLLNRGHRGRKWRGLAPGALSRFLQAWRDLEGDCQVDIRRVMGHAGDPLNEAADKIAYMALRAIAHPEKASRPTLLRGIEKALAKAHG